MRIGTFCSGGDAPGMNACVRAVVRAAVAAGHEVIGIYRGYQGLLDEDFYRAGDGTHTMSMRSVSNIIQRGGTILRTSRCAHMREAAGQRRVAEVLRRHQIDALIPIGGDGTFRGCLALANFWDGAIIGCPGTIDNDLLGTDFTIGFHTAVATAVDAVDKLRDTAESHERMFLVEVMGRHSGYIGLFTALAAGCEVACIPETPTDLASILEKLHLLKTRGKSSIIVIVAEGDETGGVERIYNDLQQAGCPFPARVITLGHLQRGGSPVPADRILASRLGEFAVQAVLSGKSGAMAGQVDGRLVLTPFDQTFAAHSRVPEELVRLLDVLAN